MEISYSKVGDYFLPNLVLLEEEKTIGKYLRVFSITKAVFLQAFQSRSSGIEAYFVTRLGKQSPVEAADHTCAKY